MSVSSLAILYAVAIISGLLFLFWDSRRYHLDSKIIWDALFYAALGGVLGQKIFYIIFFAPQQFLLDPIQSLTTSSGSMYYGAEVGGFLAMALFFFRKKMLPFNFLDSFALLLAFAHGFGRIGCFAAGCCYGVQTDSFLGVHFPHVEGFVHPTQLYETVSLLILFSVMLVVRKRKFIPGSLFTLYLVWYGLWRFLVEFIRHDANPSGPLHISPSQHFALISLISGIVLYRYIKNRPPEGLIIYK